jgi:hypothetical protein
VTSFKNEVGEMQRKRRKSAGVYPLAQNLST